MAGNRLENGRAWLAWVGGMSLGFAAVGVSCGGEDIPPAPMTIVGSTGSQGTGGAGGSKAGSSGTAGSTGTVGSTTGSAGSGGSASSGMGGTAGSAGSTGGSAGSTSSTGGSAGSAGSTGGSGLGGTGGSGVSDAGNAAQRRAAANLSGRSGVMLSGSGVFTQAATGGAVTLVVAIQLDPRDASSLHGVHIHQVLDCGPADGGATQAGAHWNPADAGRGDAGHGHPDAAMHHLGDVGNIAVGANGIGTLTFTTNDWAIGTGTVNDVVGHSLVIHAKVDDGTAGSVEGGPGNSGVRIGCGLIQLISAPDAGPPADGAMPDVAVSDARMDARDAGDGRDPDCPSNAPTPGSSCADAGAGTICQYANQRTCACNQMGAWACFP